MGDNGLTMAVLPNRIFMRHQEGPCNQKRKQISSGTTIWFKICGNKKKIIGHLNDLQIMIIIFKSNEEMTNSGNIYSSL